MGGGQDDSLTLARGHDIAWQILEEVWVLSIWVKLSAYLRLGLCSPGWSQTQYVVRDDLALVIFLHHLLRVGVTGMDHHTQFMQCWG